ncbi:hypothetical protein [Jiangella anatolica]|uniref:hypothetical protein n=1 Tax=Jiangella anatolica TaxID=2670374 RepID=UPI0018F52DF2|nr:hypothetical protein [Jiangella anatolica]
MLASDDAGSRDGESVVTLIPDQGECDATGSTDLAVVQGIGRTGRLVTSAALTLFLAFAAPAASPAADLKVMATGLGFGILLDATIIRSLLTTG